MRPSNGTEGNIFFTAHCAHCRWEHGYSHHQDIAAFAGHPYGTDEQDTDTPEWQCGIWLRALAQDPHDPVDEIHPAAPTAVTCTDGITRYVTTALTCSGFEPCTLCRVPGDE